MRWTTESVAAARRLRAQGLSYSKIADAIGGYDGCTNQQKRNSLASMFFRDRMTPEQRAQYDAAKTASVRAQRADIPKRFPDPVLLLAAAIRSDGGSMEEAMAETGLSAERVRYGMRLARLREQREIRKEQDGHAV